ncbi:MAG: hypothetical protein H6839_00570 [Planctomycetes bacterium]|nr:hypothetical protein [Planctomycetota bacterium]
MLLSCMVACESTPDSGSAEAQEQRNREEREYWQNYEAEVEARKERNKTDRQPETAKTDESEVMPSRRQAPIWKRDISDIGDNVLERLAWGDDREWVKVDTPWGKGMWGLRDGEGHWVSIPEYTSVEIGGDLAGVRCTDQLFGRNRWREYEDNYSWRLLDMDGLELSRGREFVYVEEVNCWLDGFEIVAAGALPDGMTSVERGSSGRLDGWGHLRYGYLQRSIKKPRIPEVSPGRSWNDCASAPIIEDEHRINSPHLLNDYPGVSVEPFDANYWHVTNEFGQPQTDVSLYRQGGLWGFGANTDIDLSAKGINDSKFGSSDSLLTPITGARYNLLRPGLRETWNTRDREHKIQTWFACEGEQWFRLVFENAALKSSTPLVWLPGATIWAEKLESGYRVAGNDTLFSELASRKGIPSHLAARSETGWGVLLADGRARTGFDNATEEAAWDELHREVLASVKDAPDDPGLLLLELLLDAEPEQGVDGVAAACAGLARFGMDFVCQSVVLAEARVGLPVGQRVHELLAAKEDTTADLGAFDRSLERHRAIFAADDAWEKLTLAQMLQTTIDTVTAIHADAVPAGEPGFEADLDARRGMVVGQCARLFDSTSMDVYLDFLANAPIFPGEPELTTYVAAAPEEGRRQLLYMAGLKWRVPMPVEAKELFPSVLAWELSTRKDPVRTVRDYGNVGLVDHRTGPVLNVRLEASRMRFACKDSASTVRETLDLHSSSASVSRLQGGLMVQSQRFTLLTIAIRNSPQDADLWALRAAMLCDEFASRGEGLSGMANVPGPLGEWVSGLDCDPLPTPMELWPVYRLRIFADMERARKFGTKDEALLTGIESLINFSDHAFLHMRDVEGVLSEVPPHTLELKEKACELDPTARMPFFLSERIGELNKLKYAWLMADMEGIAERKMVAEAQAERIRQSQAEALLREAKYGREVEEWRDAERKRQEKFWADLKARDKAFTESWSGSHTPATSQDNVNDSLQRMNDYYDKLGRISSGENFNDWVRSGNSQRYLCVPK